MEKMKEFIEAKKKFFVIGIQVVFVIGLLAVFGVSIKSYLDSQEKIKQLQSKLTATGNPDPTNVAEFVEKVGKHLVLPDETPRVVTIANVELLRREQPFFEKAADGDILLVYNQKVVLYNPAKDRVVDIAQIRVTAGTETATNPLGSLPASQEVPVVAGEATGSAEPAKAATVPTHSPLPTNIP